MGIQAVIFDLGGVMFTLGEAAYRRAVAQRLGLGEQLPENYEAHVPALQRGEIEERQVWQAISGRWIEQTTAFDDAWEANFLPDPAMFALAAELRERGLKTAVLSNTQASHVAIMRRNRWFDAFSPVLMSCEVGCRKPEEAIFRLALEQLGLPGSKVAFVDDVVAYVEAARTAGIHGIHHKGDASATRQALLALI
jgi:HAD superfamily hydrolase (TIGR01509 family)